MLRQTKFGAGLRTLSLLSLLAVLITGVTFAALRSQNNIITGNHLMSASANLTMSKAQDGYYSSSIAGYNFLDIEPGGPAAPATGNDLYLRNSGSTILDIGVSLSPDRLANLSNLDLRHVYLLVLDGDQGIAYGKYSLSDLKAAYTAGAPISTTIRLGKADTNYHVRLQMQIDGEAVDSTNQVEIQNMDFVFSGKAV